MKTKKAFKIIHPYAAGIDIASKEHFVAVNPELEDEPIQSFGAHTEDLYALSKWLKKCKVDTVAMEDTGIYWVSLFLILEEAGFDVVLVNARHVKNVHGKKTDVKDAEWIRQLHSCGLLSSSFQPDNYTRTLRSYVRHRKNLTDMAATHKNRMHKALELMNIKVQHVITDITGKSGQEIIRGIINGERNPELLAKYCDGRIKKSKKPEIIKSLLGVWKDEHIFELRQSFDLYYIYQKMINECSVKIDALLKQKLAEDIQSVQVQPQLQEPQMSDPKDVLKSILGVDITACYGLTEKNSVEILSEIGFNVHKWPTAKHFTSWLNLAPNNKITGGKVIKTRRDKKRNYAGQLFKIAANSIQRSDHWLAHFYRRIKARSGAGKANVATARKLAVIFYNMLKHKMEFNPLPNAEYIKRQNQQQLKRMNKQAVRLGMILVPIPTS